MKKMKQEENLNPEKKYMCKNSSSICNCYYYCNCDNGCCIVGPSFGMKRIDNKLTHSRVVVKPSPRNSCPKCPHNLHTLFLFFSVRIWSRSYVKTYTREKIQRTDKEIVARPNKVMSTPVYSHLSTPLLRLQNNGRLVYPFSQ